MMVVSSRSSQPLEKIAAQAKSSFWYQIYPEPDMEPSASAYRQAVQVGCKAVCLTVGAPQRQPG